MITSEQADQIIALLTGILNEVSRPRLLAEQQQRAHDAAEAHTEAERNRIAAVVAARETAFRAENPPQMANMWWIGGMT